MLRRVAAALGRRVEVRFAAIEAPVEPVASEGRPKPKAPAKAKAK